MARTLIAGLLGGFIVFIWQMATWMVIPLHVPAMGTLPDEAAVTSALSAQDIPSGVYSVPWTSDQAEWQDPESDWAKRHQAGPLYTIFYHDQGGPVMEPMMYLRGLGLALLAGLVAAALLCMAGPGLDSYLKRVLFVTGLGVFVAVLAHLGYWNWMRFSTAWTMGFVIDVIVGWALAGAAMAAIMKPKTESAEAA